MSGCHGSLLVVSIRSFRFQVFRLEDFFAFQAFDVVDTFAPRENYRFVVITHGQTENFQTVLFIGIILINRTAMSRGTRFCRRRNVVPDYQPKAVPRVNSSRPAATVVRIVPSGLR